MKDYLLALVIGRFQPPSNHHLQMLKEVLEISKCQKLIIVIGDCQRLEKRNFLKATEVKEILDSILKKWKINYELKVVPDLNNPPKYGEYIEKIFPEINENNCRLFTENDYTKDCFINYGHNYKVVCPTILPNKATEIREMMIKGKRDWEKLVPEEVVNYVQKNKLISRLKSLESDRG